MLVPSIFGENLFDDDWMDFPFDRDFWGRGNTKATKNLMKTDIREHDAGYELDIDLPGYKKDEIRAELENGYLTISATKSANNDEQDKKGKYIRRERYAGTMQESLVAISERKISGYYLITFRKAIQRLLKKGLTSRGYLGEFVDRDDTYQQFCRFVPLFETLFSSDDTSFIKFNDKNEPIFMEKLPSEELRCIRVREIQDGAITFIQLFCRIFGTELSKIDFEPNKCLRTLLTYFSKPNFRDALIMEGVIFEDAYGGIKRKVILPSLDNFDEKCVWDIGYRVVKTSLVSQQNSNNTEVHKNISIDKNISALVKPKSIFSRFVFLLYKVILNDRKLKKLCTHPELFFHDSKSIVNKIISNMYLRGLE